MDWQFGKFWNISVNGRGAVAIDKQGVFWNFEYIKSKTIKVKIIDKVTIIGKSHFF